jgi:hypothetical protein
MFRLTSLFTILAVLASSVQGFVSPQTKSLATSAQNSQIMMPARTSRTSLNERQWNFNDGREPWGLKNNAEIWNGRVAQMGFTVVLLQELITGKGVIASLQDGDALAYIMLGATGISVVGLTLVLAFKGKDSDISLEE